MAKLIWTKRAADNFENICEYIGKHSPAAAATFAQGLMDLIERIPDEPYGGPMVPEYQEKMLRERHFQAKYRVVYRIHQTAIEIICIAHGAQLLSNVLGEETDN
jgi:plasmid stabilization system protein ParE